MLSAITEAVNGDIEAYVKADELYAVLQGGLLFSMPNCKRVVFGLLGVLVDPIADPLNKSAKSMMPLLESRIGDFIQAAIENLTPHNEQLFVNAAYFLGQTTKRAPGKIREFLQPLLKGLVEILKMPMPPMMNVPFGGTQIGPSHMTYCSAAFTVARVANVFESEVASVFDQFAIEWTYHLGRCAEDEEKSFAFQIFLQQVTNNPRVFLDSEIGVSVLCSAFGSWWEPSDTFLAASKQIVVQFKQAIVQNGGNWENHMGRMDQNIVGSFRNRYNV